MRACTSFSSGALDGANMRHLNPAIAEFVHHQLSMSSALLNHLLKPRTHLRILVQDGKELLSLQRQEDARGQGLHRCSARPVVNQRHLAEIAS